MPRHSAGLLVHHGPAAAIELLIVHPGGPWWAAKDTGAWSIPKGEVEPGEEPLEVARREFAEELGIPPPAGEARPLGRVRLKSGKVVTAWAVRAEERFDPGPVHSNTFQMEWPPRSGELRAFPEVDRARWADAATARRLLNPAQVTLVDRLLDLLGPAGS